MTDHKKKALAYIDEGYVEVAHDDELDVSIRLAHVHATLYLAEQQRTANLIALFMLTEDDSTAFAVSGVSYADVKVQIIEGLGLA